MSHGAIKEGTVKLVIKPLEVGVLLIWLLLYDNL